MAEGSQITLAPTTGPGADADHAVPVAFLAEGRGHGVLRPRGTVHPAIDRIYPARPFALAVAYRRWVALSRDPREVGDVVLTAQALPRTGKDLKADAAIDGRGRRDHREANDLGAVKMAAERRTALRRRPHLNIYNERTLAFFAAQARSAGCRRWKCPARSWRAVLRTPGWDGNREVFATGWLLVSRHAASPHATTA